MTPSVNELLFMAAANIVEADSRQAFLEFACRGDEARLKRLERLLEIRGSAKDFFELQPEVGNVVVPAAGIEDEGGIGARIGPYRLIDRLGSGGCGIVYLAEQHVPVKRKVALKIIRLGMDTENVIARFNLEREALALMDHVNIARVLDAGATTSGRPYFVMELVDGEKILDFCDRGHLGLRQRLELFILVCEAIQHAHQKGVIHRDIKPSNVLVREEDGRAVPKVIDFGIAKATTGGVEMGATMTSLGQFMGTPAYMSPEQAEGGVDIDTRSDIYSLGALLYELLTGRPPFELEHFKGRRIEEIRGILRDEETAVPSVRLRANAKEEMEKIAGQRGADPWRLSSLLAGDLDWIVMKAIEKDRQRRYQTANGLAMDVQRYLSEEPVLARPPSRRYLLTKLVRRNRITFVAVCIALFGLLGGFGVSTWLFFRERDARQEQASLRVVAERARAYEVVLREKTQAADLVSQAAVLMNFGQMEKANGLLDSLPADRTPFSLESVKTLTNVALWNILQHRWKDGAKRYHAVAKVMTSVDLADSDDIFRELLPAASVLSEWGEPGQYADFRKMTLKRFGNSANPTVAEQVLKATLLEPVDDVALGSLADIASLIEASISGDGAEKDPDLVAWRQFSLALMALRQGHPEKACDWARRSLATGSTRRGCTLNASIILAMADLKLGRIDEGRTKLAVLRKDVNRWAASRFKVQDKDRTHWSNWQVARVLLNEAEKIPAGGGN